MYTFLKMLPSESMHKGLECIQHLVCNSLTTHECFPWVRHGAEPASASQDRPTNQRQPDSSHLSSCVLNLTPVPQWSYVHWAMCGALNQFAMPYCVPVSAPRLDGNASICFPVHFCRANTVINDAGAILITVAVAQKLMMWPVLNRIRTRARDSEICLIVVIVIQYLIPNPHTTRKFDEE